MQNQRAVLFLALAVLLGLGAVFAARHWLESQAPVATVSDQGTAAVVVALMIVAGELFWLRSASRRRRSAGEPAEAPDAGS